MGPVRAEQGSPGESKAKVGLGSPSVVYYGWERQMTTMILLVIGLASIAVAIWLFRKNRETKQALTDLQTRISRYSGISNIEAAVATKKAELEQIKRESGKIETKNDIRSKDLESTYQAALTQYNGLKQEVSLFEEDLNDISFGLYKPHFTFDTSAEYKTALSKLRADISALIKSKEAATCQERWLVKGSSSEGNRMMNQTMKVILRAFNGECDAALANVNWNNITKMEERVCKSCEAIDKMGDTLKISITPKYLKLRLDELRLANDYEVKKHQEREEQHALREQMRDEQKAQQEIEEAQEEAENEETSYQRLLEKARKEATEATGAQLQRLTEQVAGFEAKLDEARKKKERAKSRAEQTKSGFVYVISNIGTFGEGVYKIGMTRRMEPLDRIAELSGASVPFPFDVHAMMFSMDAPALETGLHRFFDDRKVNLVNARKEFYQHVQLAEIETFIKNQGISAQFIELPEAREWRETVAKRQGAKTEEPKQAFASSLFGNN